MLTSNEQKRVATLWAQCSSLSSFDVNDVVWLIEKLVEVDLEARSFDKTIEVLRVNTR